MAISTALTRSWLFDSFPPSVQDVLAAHAEKSGVSVFAVITFAVSDFLELAPVLVETQMQNGTSSISELPVELQQKIQKFVEEYPAPLEFVVELAITSFVDPEACTFDDAKPWFHQERFERLQKAVVAQAPVH